MSNKAFLVGINKYPTSPLRGCLNDVVDMATFLNSRCGFEKRNIHLLTDGRATAINIVGKLEQFLSTLTPGDKAVFHYSGHGAQVADRNGDGEVDKLDETICPVDFDWDNPASMVIDDSFKAIFTSFDVLKKVSLLWISDSCHSGDLTRDFRDEALIGEKYTKPRVMIPDADHAWRLAAFDDMKGQSRSASQQLDFEKNKNNSMSRAVKTLTEKLPLVFLSGCQSNQVSMDANFNGRANGALTHSLLKVLNVSDLSKISMIDLHAKILQSIKGEGFEQRPSLEGDPSLLKKAFLGGV
jgi:hypothetical protein